MSFYRREDRDDEEYDANYIRDRQTPKDRAQREVERLRQALNPDGKKSKS